MQICLWCYEPFFEPVSWKAVFGLQKPQKACGRCLAKFEEIHGVCCELCGRPFERVAKEFQQELLCLDCVRWNTRFQEERPLEKNRSIYVYNEFLQEVIARWKYRGDAELVKLFAEPLRALVGREFLVDVVVPIPISQARLYERSFNQSELLAEMLSYPVVCALRRDGESSKQSKKTREERLLLDGKFQVNPSVRNELIGKSVLLIDDIYTTGATLHSAATMVRDAGAKRVCSVTVARG